MSVHIVSSKDVAHRHTDSGECWCCPRVDWIDPDTELPYENGPFVVHNAYEGYPAEGEGIWSVCEGGG